MSTRSSEATKNNHDGNADDQDDDDDDDLDYVPPTETNPHSDEDEPNDGGNDDEDYDDIPVKNKKAKLTDKQTKTCEESDESKSKKNEELWSNFLSDVKTSPTKTNKGESSKPVTQNILVQLIKSPTNTSAAKAPTTPTKSTTTSSLEARPKGSGIASILNKINKQPKLSTLEKSRQDWEEFKKSENIEEDLNKHSKGKESYLEKRAFLERADYRQYEIEKGLRTKERKLRETH